MRPLSKPLTCLLLLSTACATADREAAPRWTLTETLRIGSAEVGPTSFDRVKSIAVDSAGRIFVYNHGTQDIRMFDADGELIRVIGRLGSGPGELRNAEGATITRDGKLWVRDAANARFSIFSGEGDFESSWTARFCTSQGSWVPLSDSLGRIVSMDCVPRAGERPDYVALAYRTDLSGVDTLANIPDCGSPELAEAATWITRTPTSTSYRSIPFAARAVREIGMRGELWCVPNSAAYEILRLRDGATDTLRIVRDVAPVPVTDFERDSVIAALEVNGPTGLDYDRIPTVKAAIERLTVDDQGRLWVRRTNAQGEIELDVFDAEGNFVATADLGVFHTSIFMPFLVRGDNIYTVVLGEDDIPFVTRFGISQ